jgi:hypothetical protein
MKNLLQIVFALTLLFIVTGCASITGSSTQSVSVQTYEQADEEVVGASCELSNDEGNWFVMAPGSVSIHRSNKDLQVTCKKSSSGAGRAAVVSDIKAAMFGNIIFGGPIGVIIDHTSGAAYEYPAAINIQMGSFTKIETSKKQSGQTNNLPSDSINNSSRKDGNTPLIWAAFSGHTDAAKSLIEQGANVNSVNNSGETPLSLAAINGQLETAKLLVEKGANVNSVTNSGDTPLIFAASNGHTETARLLITQGAHVALRNKAGETALGLAKNNNHTETYNVIAVAELNAELKSLIATNDMAGLRAFLDIHPNALSSIKNAKLRLRLTGPAELRIEDIAQLVKSKKKDALIIAKISSTAGPYKKFTDDEMDALQGMDISDEVVAAMIAVTNEYNNKQKRAVEQQQAAQQQAAQQQAARSQGSGGGFMDNLVKGYANNMMGGMADKLGASGDVIGKVGSLGVRAIQDKGNQDTGYDPQPSGSSQSSGGGVMDNLVNNYSNKVMSDSHNTLEAAGGLGVVMSQGLKAVEKDNNQGDRSSQTATQTPSYQATAQSGASNGDTLDCFKTLSGTWQHPVGGTWKFEGGNRGTLVLDSTNYGAAAQQITELSFTSCDSTVMHYKIVRAALINTVDPDMAYDKTPENAPTAYRWSKVYTQAYSMVSGELALGNYTYRKQ